MRTYLFGAALALAMGMAGASHAQLVVDGETITSAENLAAGKAEGRLVHYGAYPPDAMKIIHEAFTADTGIPVDFIRMSTAPLFQRIVSEAAANQLAADIVDLTDIVMVSDLMDRGILNVPYKVPSFDRIPDDLKDTEGRWYSYINPIWTVAVNTARIQEADFPKSWSDLLDPKYDGQLAIVNVDGGSAFSMYSMLREKISDTFWQDLAARKPRIYESVSPLTADLARGDVGIAITAPEPVMLQIAAGAPLKTFYFDQGTPSFPDAGGITATAKHPNAAKVFLDWITSKRGGNAVAKALAFGINPDSADPKVEGGDYPARADLWIFSPETWRQTHQTGREEWRKLMGR
ncbi:MAG TPA: extracellular solute-binding protein [Rhizobiaceae bacterium]|nr:extracellular solute-binding protein [Rhizobiaceae bacterium]